MTGLLALVSLVVWTNLFSARSVFQIVERKEGSTKTLKVIECVWLLSLGGSAHVLRHVCGFLYAYRNFHCFVIC